MEQEQLQDYQQDFMELAFNIPSDKEVKDIVASIMAMIESAKQEAESTSSSDIKEQLYSYSEEAQSFLNKILNKTGVVTKEQVDQLDEQVRAVKQKILLEKASESQKRLILGTLAVVGIIGVLWFITKK